MDGKILKRGSVEPVNSDQRRALKSIPGGKNKGPGHNMGHPSELAGAHHVIAKSKKTEREKEPDGKSYK